MRPDPAPETFHLCTLSYTDEAGCTIGCLHSAAGVQIRVQDNVNAQHQLVTEKFGIESLVAVLGWSMGAGQTFQWAVRSAQSLHYWLGDINARLLPANSVAGISNSL